MTPIDITFSHSQVHRLGKVGMGRLLAAILVADLAQAETAWLATYSAARRIAVKRWKSLRDAQLIKQELEFLRCSSAC